jgi:predicted PurR-regulated permease PerM
MENIGTRGRLMYAGIGLVFALLLAIYFVHQVREVVLVFLLTLLLSIIISAPVDYLAHKGMSRGWGTLIVLGSLTLVFVLVALALAPAVGNQVRQLVETLPTILSDVQNLVERVSSALRLGGGTVPDSQQLIDSAQNFLSGDTFSAVLGVGASVAHILSLALVVLIATIFVVARPGPLVNGLVSFFPAGRRERVREILGKMYRAVQYWFLGQLAYMVLVGVLFTIALFIIGVPFALLFGILAGLLSFIPIVGPLLYMIPPALVAFFEDPIMALWVVLVYLVLQLLESNLFHPVVMSRAIALHPAVIIFALLIMGTILGVIGILLAIPLVAALKVLVRELWIKRMDEKGTDPNPPPKEEEHSMEKNIGRLRRAAGALFRRS